MIGLPSVGRYSDGTCTGRYDDCGEAARVASTEPSCHGWWACLGGTGQATIIAAGMVCLTAIVVALLLLRRGKRQR